MGEVGKTHLRRGDPRYKKDHRVSAGRPSPYAANGAIFTAMAIAKEFASRAPTVQQLQDRFGMSRASAYRWLAAIKFFEEKPQ